MIDHIRSALSKGLRAGDKVESILDIGCGSGNATFALNHLYPDASIIASDFSPSLLKILKKRAIQNGCSENIVTVVADASKLDITPSSLDVVVGSSMLHHLIDPGEALVKILTGLRSGGTAYFFEPFAPGYCMMRNALRSLVTLNKSLGGFSEEDIEIFERLIFGVDFVLEPTRAHPLLKELDDKWLFTKHQFSLWAEDAGCSVSIDTTNPMNETIEEKINAIMKSAKGSLLSFPPWSIEYLADLDKCRTPEIRQDLLMEGSIVMRKL